jgi:hypothetical protein
MHGGSARAARTLRDPELSAPVKRVLVDALIDVGAVRDEGDVCIRFGSAEQLASRLEAAAAGSKAAGVAGRSEKPARPMTEAALKLARGIAVGDSVAAMRLIATEQVEREWRARLVECGKLRGSLLSDGVFNQHVREIEVKAMSRHLALLCSSDDAAVRSAEADGAAARICEAQLCFMQVAEPLAATCVRLAPRIAARDDAAATRLMAESMASIEAAVESHAIRASWRTFDDALFAQMVMRLLSQCACPQTPRRPAPAPESPPSPIEPTPRAFVYESLCVML